MLVLWDFDGTIADTRADVWVSLQYAARRCSGNFPDEFMGNASNLALPMRDIFRNIRPRPDASYEEGFVDDVAWHYRNCNEFARTSLYSGIDVVLDEVKAYGGRNVIVTNKPVDALERILTQKSWGGWFEGWVCAQNDGSALEMKERSVSRALEVYGSRSEACVYVGDSWSDVVAARANGVSCIGVTYGDGDVQKLRRACPLRCVASVPELRQELKGVMSDVE